MCAARSRYVVPGSLPSIMGIALERCKARVRVNGEITVACEPCAVDHRAPAPIMLLARLQHAPAEVNYSLRYAHTLSIFWSFQLCDTTVWTMLNTFVYEAQIFYLRDSRHRKVLITLTPGGSRVSDSRCALLPSLSAIAQSLLY